MTGAAAETSDLAHLDRCLDLAARARGRTNPNPMVGALLVSEGEIVGEGYHRRAGEPHAERLALQQAGARARGAVLYTNMEPCCHHGRTPPCVEAVIEAGVRRVVASLRDPDPRVDGKGFAALRAAGVEVETGLRADEAAELNEGYLCVKRLGRPFVIGKAALSLDGRMATRVGQSQWITGPEARAMGHELRARTDAVLVGSGTLLADDPRLTARDAEGPGPRVRAVLDSRGSTPTTARFLAESKGLPLVITTAACPAGTREQLEAAGATVTVVEAAADGRVDIGAALVALAEHGVANVLVEGGSRLLTAGFELGIIDKLLLFYAPLLIGGSDALPLWGGRGAAELGSALRIQRVRHHRLGADWAVEGYLRPPLPPSQHC